MRPLTSPARSQLKHGGTLIAQILDLGSSSGNRGIGKTKTDLRIPCKRVALIDGWGTVLDVRSSQRIMSLRSLLDSAPWKYI